MHANTDRALFDRNVSGIIDGGWSPLSDSRLNHLGANILPHLATRQRISLFLLAAAALVGVTLVAGGYWKFWQANNDAATSTLPPTLNTFPEGRPLAEFALVDDAKGVFDLNSLNSRWSFLFFGFMYCPDICPTTLYDMSQVKREIVATGIEAEALQFVFISVDPARDKALQLQRYVQYFDPDFVSATGSIGQLTNLTRQLGAPFRAEPATAENVYEVTHSSAIYLVDPLGQYAGIISPPLVPANVATEFSRLYRARAPHQLTGRN